MVPSFPVESMSTVTAPTPTVLPLIPAMKALVWEPFPILMAADSVATPGLPI